MNGGALKIPEIPSTTAPNNPQTQRSRAHSKNHRKRKESKKQLAHNPDESRRRDLEGVQTKKKRNRSTVQQMAYYFF